MAEKSFRRARYLTSFEASRCDTNLYWLGKHGPIRTMTGFATFFNSGDTGYGGSPSAGERCPVRWRLSGFPGAAVRKHRDSRAGDLVRTVSGSTGSIRLGGAAAAGPEDKTFTPHVLRFEWAPASSSQFRYHLSQRVLHYNGQWSSRLLRRGLPRQRFRPAGIGRVFGKSLRHERRVVVLTTDLLRAKQKNRQFRDFARVPAGRLCSKVVYQSAHAAHSRFPHPPHHGG